MKKQSKKKKRKQQKQTKKALSFAILILTISAFLFYLLRTEKNDRNNSQITKIKIEYLRCPKGYLNRKQSGIIKFQHQEKERFLKIRKSSCSKLKQGDSLNIYYLKKKDKFYEIID